MTTLKSLPVRPSLESIRKQAKKLSRDVLAGNHDALARARAQLPRAKLPLSARDAQLVLAREYGFAGWQDLRQEVLKRTGQGLDWAATEALHAIHDNRVETLAQLLTDYPGLLSWRDENGRGLLRATLAFANNVTDPAREQMYCRPACAELLIDAGAKVEASIWESVIGTGAAQMLQLLQSKAVLPPALPVLAALGDLDAVRANLDAVRADLAGVNHAFLVACRFKHRAVARLLLERCILLDHNLGGEIDGWQDRSAFVEYMCEHSASLTPTTPWRAFVLRQLMDTIENNDLPAFVEWLRAQPWLLGKSCVGLQVELLEQAALSDRAPFITYLLDLSPAILELPAPPSSSAIIFAIEYGHAYLIPLLTRVWPLPDDLPHAAGTGDFDRVKRWFDSAGQPAFGDLRHHYPANNPDVRNNLRWGAPNLQQVLDVALAWACMNRQFAIAAFLLEHGANINTNWSTHEPASILHECALHHNFEAAKFLVEHGIDLTLLDYRWNATAEGWAYHAANDEEMAAFLAAARQR